jgi:hypothetical protein
MNQSISGLLMAFKTQLLVLLIRFEARKGHQNCVRLTRITGVVELIHTL